jgi:uncharacterized OB-fold protein
MTVTGDHAQIGRGMAMSPDQQFSAFLKEGKFMLQRCLADGRYWFYPRILCPHCGSSELEWSEVSGDGTVYSTTIVRRKPEEGGDHNVALVDLDEGPRMMSRVDGIALDAVRIGMRVKARIAGNAETPLIVFTPAEAAP